MVGFSWSCWSWNSCLLWYQRFSEEKGHKLKIRFSLIFLGILSLSLIIFGVSAVLGVYIGSGSKVYYYTNYTFQEEQASIIVGDVNPVPHKEAYAFVIGDSTSENEYTDGYNCVDFALDLWRNAAWEGIESRIIGLELNFGPGHVAVGFPNEDGLLLIVDPMTDAIMNPVVGVNGFSDIWELNFVRNSLEAYNGSN